MSSDSLSSSASLSVDPNAAPSRGTTELVSPVDGHGGGLPHLNLVFVGHVDHGKSTLIGRLLFDTNSIPEGKYEQIQAACKAEGMEFEFAFLLDALLEEQAQNITMDTTRVPFRTAKRAFTIIDAPGHKEFLKNMITGAASADAAVLIVDAHDGIKEQTRRHGYLLSLLGIEQVVVAVNKMDLAGYDPAVFSRIENEVTGFLAKLQLKPAHVIPISARSGEGIVHRNSAMPWYQGPSLLEALESFRGHVHPDSGPLRFNVQDVYKFDTRRIVAGVVESGKITVGDPIEFFPGGKGARIKTIETWPATAADASASVGAGRAVAVTLDEEIFLERGNVGAAPGNGPSIGREFNARLFWMHPLPLRVGEAVPLRIGTQQMEARVTAVTRVVDTDKLDDSHLSANDVQRHQVALIRLRTTSPIVYDLGSDAPTLRRFVLMRNGRIGGGGVIDSAAENVEATENLPIPLAARQALLGHRGAVIWLTGLSGAGKSTLATGVERRLLRAGVLPVILDGDILRAGLCQGLGFSDADRRENIRRAAEAALLVAEAGSIVITALISPFRADRQLVAERCKARGIAFAEVYVNAPLAECERRDPKHLYRRARAGEIRAFTGISSPYEPPLAPTLEIHTDKETVEESIEKLATLGLRLARPDPRLRYLAQLIGPESAISLASTARGSSLVTVFGKTFEYVATRVARRVLKRK